ncbi:MAG: Stp1/IreP family PP2C-type Ser/Thr phosphatase [Ruminococcaceae bacterium]|nr:Stp1/IreP family PP2C-type Ser/Thr phosphatase [Oscillospiraceae bacterium]
MNSWTITSKGAVRQQNQDACFAECDPERNMALLLVCDGMGGALAGNVASNKALEAFVEYLKREDENSNGRFNMVITIENAITAANESVFNHSNTCPECKGMGTTMVGALIMDDRTAVFNVGDSRAYHIRPRSIKKITVDHSIVEELVLRGDITREQAARHPGRNLITRAIGTEADVECDIFFPNIRHGDYLLLCSDGLSNIVTEKEIMDEVIKGGAPDDCCRRLLDIAMQRGAPDNVTVVLFRK